MARNLSGSLVSFAFRTVAAQASSNARLTHGAIFGDCGVQGGQYRGVPGFEDRPGCLKPSARIGREQRQSTQHRLHRPSQPVIQMNRLQLGRGNRR